MGSDSDNDVEMTESDKGEKLKKDAHMCQKSSRREEILNKLKSFITRKKPSAEPTPMHISRTETEERTPS